MSGSRIISETPACTFCGESARRHFVLAHATTFRCLNPRCRLQFVAPQPDDEALDRAYAEMYYPKPGSMGPLENTPEGDIRHLFARIEARYGPARGKRILDYGCGTGSLMGIARELGAKTTGIEQSAVARETAATGGLARVYGDVDALLAAEPEAAFDWIVLCSVVEHLRRPWEDLRQLRGLLKPGGVVIMTTPNADSLKSALRGAQWDQRTNPTHLYYFTPTSLAAVLRGAGFSAVTPLAPIVDFAHHGVLRRNLQHLLGALHLQGGLFFAAGDRSGSQADRRVEAGVHVA